MPKLTIDGMEITVEPGTSIIQAAEQLGIEIPRFCYHDRLSVPANCRMCLVEVEKSPKPVASCAMPCADDMKVFTNTPMVHKARKGVMEMLLINHPLDCPICDQGGECDLQDQSVAYGFDRSRYGEEKRAVKDKDLGPLVKTVMTRCIHCTRCVRFADEIAGVSELGVLNRGEHLEIGTYVSQAVSSELSGNLIDVCPVGALTSKPYAFTARPWELRKVDSIDVSDAVGGNIRLDVRGGEVMRVLPRLHEEVNEEWMHDKARFAWDGLKLQRLDRPYLRNPVGRLVPCSWSEAFDAIAEKVKTTPGANIGAVVGDLADCEAMIALKDLMASLGASGVECRQDGAQFDTAVPAGYVMNTGIAGVEDADAVLLIGCNPRHEAPMVNARIRKAWVNNRAKVGVIGAAVELNYPSAHLGAGAEALDALADGTHPFAAVLKAAQKPVLILGQGALRRADGMSVQKRARDIAMACGLVRDDWNGFNMLHVAASRMGGILLGLTQEGGVETMLCKDILFLLGAEELPMEKTRPETFVIYQGHHGDAGAARADVILPGAAYTEKNATYVNTEGRVQQARQAVFAPGDAREDWAIIRALSDILDKSLPYDTLPQVRARLAEAHPHFAEVDVRLTPTWADFGQAGEIAPEGFAHAIENYYMTDPITRASRVMAEATAAFVKASDAGGSVDGKQGKVSAHA